MSKTYTPLFIIDRTRKQGYGKLNNQPICTQVVQKILDNYMQNYYTHSSIPHAIYKINSKCIIDLNANPKIINLLD